MRIEEGFGHSSNGSAPVVKLATPPTVDEEVKAEALKLLEEYADRVRSGEIESVIVIGKKPDGFWSFDHSKLVAFPEAIGRIQIALHEWINGYLGMTQ